MSAPASHPPAVITSASSAVPANDAAPHSTQLIHAAEAAALPTSFGVFKPVGYMMTGVPAQTQVDALVSALHGAGWPAAGVRQFSPRESAAELRAMVDNAGPLAGIGYEISMLRRYVALTEEGYRWLLVQVHDSEQAEQAAALARACGATVAVHYRMLTIEELIP
jgi:hypothetical protein